MSAKKKYRNTHEYLKYLKGELSREERHSFERDLQADPFEREALDGMEQVSADELEEDILSLHSTLRKRLQRRRRRTLYYVAASVASLLLVGTVFLNIYDINPKSATESIPKDERERSQGVPASPAPEETRVQAAEPLEEYELEMEDAQNIEYDQILEYEEDHAEMEIIAEEAPAPEEAAPGQVAVAPVKEAAAPVKEADELVVMEAQPGDPRKKGRSLRDKAEEAQEAQAQEAQAQEALGAKARKALAPEPVSGGIVRGIVLSSEDMEPLPGASIVVKGSDSGMVADMKGRFSLVSGQEAQTTVIASYVGMETGEYRLAEGAENRVVMQPDKATLDEVVVIGSEADQSIYATGAVQTLTREKEDSIYGGAQPEGGPEAFKMYIEEHIRFPAGDTIGKREIVVMRFNVDADGTISRIESLRSPGQPFTEEAIRLLLEGPDWKPARNENGPTDDVVRLRIVFKQ